MTSGGANRDRIAVRGISTAQGQLLQQATVGQFVDEIVTDSGTGATTTLDSRLFDVERVELLRGPQGTLFGSGSLSGAMRIITNKPDLDAFHVTTEVRGESIEDGELGGGVSGMLNVPLVQGKLGVRAVAYGHNEGGYIDNAKLGQEDTNSEHVRGGRLIVAAQPMDALSLQATVLHQDSKTYRRLRIARHSGSRGARRGLSIDSKREQPQRAGVLGGEFRRAGRSRLRFAAVLDQL